jgi:hypothetical protein
VWQSLSFTCCIQTVEIRGFSLHVPAGTIFDKVLKRVLFDDYRWMISDFFAFYSFDVRLLDTKLIVICSLVGTDRVSEANYSSHVYSSSTFDSSNLFNAIRTKHKASIFLFTALLSSIFALRIYN